MNVVCINNEIYPQLKVGTVYKAAVIFWLKEEGGISEIDWKKNYLNLEGFSEIDWFSTDYFVTMDKWREMQINQLI